MNAVAARLRCRDLGVYSNVEPVRRPFLEALFGDASGNLYEGQASDFDRETVAAMDLDTNESKNDRGDLERVVAALEPPDDALLPALGAAIDLDQFRDFWAIEALIGHWDGYSGNANNYYAYHDTIRDRFVFIPWGTDQAFSTEIPNDADNAGLVVYAKGRITRRLYALREERDRFRQRLGELATSLWDPRCSRPRSSASQRSRPARPSARSMLSVT